MGHRVGQVEKERAAILRRTSPPEEVDRPLGIPLGQRGLILGADFGVDDRFIFKEWQRRIGPRFGCGMVGPHVVGVGQPEILVKPMPSGQKVWVVAQVPLANHAGAVAAGGEQFSQRRLVSREAVRVSWAEGSVNPDPVGIAAGQQGRSGGRADRLGDMKIGEANALTGEPVDLRRRGNAAAVAGRVGIAHVISKDDHDVGGRLPRRLPGWFGGRRLRLSWRF